MKKKLNLVSNLFRNVILPSLEKVLENNSHESDKINIPQQCAIFFELIKLWISTKNDISILENEIMQLKRQCKNENYLNHIQTMISQNLSTDNFENDVLYYNTINNIISRQNTMNISVCDFKALCFGLLMEFLLNDHSHDTIVSNLEQEELQLTNLLSRMWYFEYKQEEQVWKRTGNILQHNDSFPQFLLQEFNDKFGQLSRWRWIVIVVHRFKWDGTLELRNGKIFRGKFQINQLIHGPFVKNGLEGEGTKYQLDGTVCKGFFTGSKLVCNWSGSRVLPNGDTQIGIFQRDCLVEQNFADQNFKGQGRKAMKNGCVCDGDFDGQRCVSYWVGTKTHPNGIVEEGRFENNILLK